MFWEKYNAKKINETVFEAINKNLNYRDSPPIGLPGSYLDPKVFYSDAPFLREAPYMSTMMANPNHIGCHTLGDSEPVFEGTQALEQEVIAICAAEIFGAAHASVDGYVASGGTEANIQSFWVLRNYYIEEKKATHNEIALVYSSDAHYSMPKGANVLNMKSIVAQVNHATRQIDLEPLQHQLLRAKSEGINCFILVMNMATTMFGSVDDISAVTRLFESLNLDFKIHVDGAYGGFIYPFSAENPLYSFKNKHIFSFSLDGHKMLLSPYGTGIVLMRKNYIHHTMTKEAQYVKGRDYTLIGSRSGANAIAIWMILRTYGSQGWKAKIEKLLDRTAWLCHQLDQRKISYYRNPDMNIVTIRGEYIAPLLAKQYFLVPDSHGSPRWWKIVVMDHVTQEVLNHFLIDLDKKSK